MQDAIGNHALLADSRTAALVDSSGNVAWFCAPRVDSDPLLFSLLDERRGGEFSLRPARPDATVVGRRYHPRTLVSETVWAVGRSQVTVDDALLLGDAPALLRRVRCRGEPVEMQVRWRAGRWPGREASDLLPRLSNPAAWHDHGGVQACGFRCGDETVLLSVASAAPAGDPLPATIDAWRSLVPPFSELQLSALALPDEGSVRPLLETSACVLAGLQQRGGGIVAAPTTSLPQWPGTPRTWDYRYCWMRDAALAATAMLRVGLTARAVELAGFLGEVLQRGEPPPLLRVDGTEPPAERVIDELSGYRGARPVRIGNGAAAQLQIDISGELTQLARALADHDALPVELARACESVAGWAAEHWQEPDHGIWEIRGRPRHYTHSLVMAWTALRDAAVLARAGHIHGDPDVWSSVADRIRAAVLGQGGDALQLTTGGGGADAALACVPLVGFLPPDDRRTLATLDLIVQQLDRGGLLERCPAEQEALPDPCAPFLFPTFWMAAALQLGGRSGAAHFGAALAARGPLGLLAEVAEPASRAPLGNYPQVQSHAAFILAATAG